MATASIERIRENYVPEAFGGVDDDEVHVGRNSAFNKGFFDLTGTYTIVFLLVLGMSVVLLTVVFRSIWWR